MTDNKDPLHLDVSSNGGLSRMCLCRETGTAIILRAQLVDIPHLMSIARSLRTPPLRVMVHPTNEDLIVQLEALGWERTELVVFQDANTR